MWMVNYYAYHLSNSTCRGGLGLKIVPGIHENFRFFSHFLKFLQFSLQNHHKIRKFSMTFFSSSLNFLNFVAFCTVFFTWILPGHRALPICNNDESATEYLLSCVFCYCNYQYLLLLLLLPLKKRVPKEWYETCLKEREKNLIFFIFFASSNTEGLEISSRIKKNGSKTTTAYQYVEKHKFCRKHDLSCMNYYRAYFNVQLITICAVVNPA